MSTIYKFRDWNDDHHKDVLTKQQFFCSSISKFNDPFDSRIPIDYASLSNQERIEAVENHVTNNYPRAIGAERHRLIERVIRESAIMDPDQLRENYYKVVIPEIESEIGILSFAGNKEHILLWSHYANSHKGFCVGLDREALYQIYLRPLLLTQKKFIKLYDVRYQKDYPSINPLRITDEEYYSLPLTIKSDIWQYEDEVRLIYKDGANKLITIDKDFFVEVTLGCQMLKKDEEEILEIIDSEFGDLPVYKSEINENSYSLKFQQIR